MQRIKLNEVGAGCPDLAGLKLDISKAESNGWTVNPATGEMFKFFNIYGINVMVAVDARRVGGDYIIIDVFGMDHEECHNLYTCDCSLWPPIPEGCGSFTTEATCIAYGCCWNGNNCVPHPCINIPPAIIDQICTEVLSEVPPPPPIPLWVPAVIVGGLILASLIYYKLK